MRATRRHLPAATAASLGAATLMPRAALAASAHRLNQEVDQALRTLYASYPKARELSKNAKAILIFPRPA